MVFGDVFISVDRVEDNAAEFDCSMEEEMKRVMAHGLLHLLGYEDGTPEEKKVMRKKEEECIKMFHVEQ
ncbi:MAG: rRNA maturation RNase YbeY [Bacteroidota bacterium]